MLLRKNSLIICVFVCVCVCEVTVQTLTAAETCKANCDHNAELLLTRGTAVLRGALTQHNETGRREQVGGLSHTRVKPSVKFIQIKSDSSPFN